ncbi:MAG: hypothetical protein NXH99_01445 [Rhodobacteraceae bacterium]|nr:hypothetical protein [Paracoccaceae bacterium]
MNRLKMANLLSRDQRKERQHKAAPLLRISTSRKEQWTPWEPEKGRQEIDRDLDQWTDLEVLQRYLSGLKLPATKKRLRDLEPIETLLCGMMGLVSNALKSKTACLTFLTINLDKNFLCNTVDEDTIKILHNRLNSLRKVAGEKLEYVAVYVPSVLNADGTATNRHIHAVVSGLNWHAEAWHSFGQFMDRENRLHSRRWHMSWVHELAGLESYLGNRENLLRAGAKVFKSRGVTQEAARVLRAGSDVLAEEVAERVEEAERLWLGKYGASRGTQQSQGIVAHMHRRLASSNVLSRPIAAKLEKLLRDQRAEQVFKPPGYSLRRCRGTGYCRLLTWPFGYPAL